jgi:electron transport complex protein RnfG
MKESLKLGAILFLITAICCGLLGFINSITTPIIAENKKTSQNQAMKMLVEEAAEFTEVTSLKDETITQLFIAKSKGKSIGTVAKLVTSGYGGPLTVLAGFDLEGNIKGIKILSHTETPGLGANAAKESFVNQFIKKLPPLNVVKSVPKDNEIEAITGATITSAAIVKGVNEASQYVSDHKEELMSDSQVGGK